MKLLIVTQVIDTQHPILGFFHRWVAEFAKHVEHIHVIALQVGEHNLPQNVTVHSLGKEHGANMFQKLSRFFKLVFGLRNEYDAVFVHMNPEYIVLAGWWWRLASKRVGLWYNHTVGSFWLRTAHLFTSIVFHTSPYAYTTRYKNAQRMPAGIDTDVFKPHPEVEKIPRSIYFQGRIAPAKNVHILIDAFSELHARGEADLLTLVGPEDEDYTAPLKKQYAELITLGALVFKGSVPNAETPKLYAAHAVSVNLTARGNYDKTVLESVACGTPCLASSDAFAGILDSRLILKEATADVLASSLRDVLGQNTSSAFTSMMQRMQESIVREESLRALGGKIAQWSGGS